MPSISSASQIRQRTITLLDKIPKDDLSQTSQVLISCLLEHIKYEYSIISEQERIGKA